MRYRFGLWLELSREPAPRGVPAGKTYPSLDDFLDEIMERLIDHGQEEPTIGGSLTTGKVEIVVTVDADGPEQAVHEALAIIRSAIQAADGWTLCRGRFPSLASCPR